MNTKRSNYSSIPRKMSFWRIKKTLFEKFSNTKFMVLLCLGPVFILVLATSFLPIMAAIPASFAKIPLFGKSWEWRGFQNFTELLTSLEFFKASYRSIIFGTGSTIFQLILGVGCALMARKTMKGIKIFRALILLPYLIPVIVIAMVFRLIGNSSYGMINDILIRIGVLNSPISFFGDLDLAMVSVIFVNSWKFTPFITIMVLARLLTIPNSYYDAAKIYGASAFQQFRDITLPSIRGVLLLVILIRGTWMFNKFDSIWLLTAGGPKEATTTLPVMAFETGFKLYNLGKSAAIGTLLFVILVIVAIIYFRVFRPEEEVRSS
jgi:multiple sugar transport system permease protein